MELSSGWWVCGFDTDTVTARGTPIGGCSARGGDFYLATREDFDLATRGDFKVAMDTPSPQRTSNATRISHVQNSTAQVRDIRPGLAPDLSFSATCNRMPYRRHAVLPSLQQDTAPARFKASIEPAPRIATRSK